MTDVIRTATKTETLDPTTLRRVLVTDIGLDGGQLSDEPQSTLEDLGMDSLAQVELGVVLQGRYGVRDLPEDAATMSFDQLAARLCG